ncbi:MAG TPA: response regulator [Clostridiales bacterium]|nr:response regulator [Clostridiales bacterium]
MYRLLIVDDEPDIVEGLLIYLKNAEDLELDIYTAYSGYEALSILSSSKIDILLTDILMPGMTGLELLEKVHASWPYCRVIFLTGHDEFEYVYKAIRYDVVSYILKTEGFEKVGEAVAKAAAQIENSLKISELAQKAEEYLRIALPFMQKEYMTDLIKGDGWSMENRRQQFDELKIPLDCNKPVFLLLGRIHDFDSNMMLHDKSKLQITLQNIMKQCFSQELKIFFTSTERHTYLWIIQPPCYEGNIANQLKGSAEAIQNICMDQLKAYISFIVDSDMVTWEDLPGRYEYLKNSLYTCMEPGTNVLLISQVPVKPNQAAGSPIETVIAYINSHIDEDISLAKLADLVYFNPSYLSRLFKQTTGINLLTYINKIRLEKAKKLLRETNMKIHEISSSVGYVSPSYFTQFFRKNVNMNPQEYRDLHRKL